jgi:hypothetical protein
VCFHTVIGIIWFAADVQEWLDARRLIDPKESKVIEPCPNTRELGAKASLGSQLIDLLDHQQPVHSRR